MLSKEKLFVRRRYVTWMCACMYAYIHICVRMYAYIHICVRMCVSPTEDGKTLFIHAFIEVHLTQVKFPCETAVSVKRG